MNTFSRRRKYSANLGSHDETEEIFQECCHELESLFEECRYLEPLTQGRLLQMIVEYFKVLRSTFKLGSRNNQRMQSSTLNFPHNNGPQSVCSYDEPPQFNSNRNNMYNSQIQTHNSQIQTPISTFTPQSATCSTLNSMHNNVRVLQEDIQNILRQMNSFISSKFNNARQAYEYLDSKNAGYLSISMLKLGLEHLGIPVELTGRASFSEYLQKKCPNRLVAVADFVDMFEHDTQINSNISFRSATISNQFNRMPNSTQSLHPVPVHVQQPPPFIKPVFMASDQPTTHNSFQQTHLVNPQQPWEERSVSRQSSAGVNFPKKADNNDNFNSTVNAPIRPQTAPALNSDAMSNHMVMFQKPEANLPESLKDPFGELKIILQNQNQSVIELFNEFKGSDGAVSAESLVKKMQQFGIKYSSQFLAPVIQKFDSNNDLKLNLIEWECLCQNLMTQQIATTAQSNLPIVVNENLKYITNILMNAETSLSTLFKKLCVSGGRRCSVDDMIQGLQKYGVNHLNKFQIQEIMSDFEKNDGQGITRAEFIRMINAGKSTQC